MTGLRVVRASFATLQDQGRAHHRSLGVPVSGMLDPAAGHLANALVGSAPGAAVIEYRLGPLLLEAVGSAVRIALVGPLGRSSLVGAHGAITYFDAHETIVVPPGAQVICAAPAGHGCGYLAVAGGFCVRPVLASLATTLNAGFGGLDGRLLAPHDHLPVGSGDRDKASDRECDGDEYRPADPAAGDVRLLHAPAYGAAHDGVTSTSAESEAHPAREGCPEAKSATCRATTDKALTVRVVPGPQFDHFTVDARKLAQETSWQVTPAVDRMGMRLAGPALEHGNDAGRGANIDSDGMCPGAIQVPADGQPIVLLADCQTTGGYAKLGVVIGPDLRRLAHVGPGDRVQFAFVTPRVAVEAARDWASHVATLATQTAPIVRTRAPTTADLLGANLISGVTFAEA
ncbi:MAG: hypothetical protein AAGF32_06425 [Pseudomonadota bacterium]